MVCGLDHSGSQPFIYKTCFKTYIGYDIHVGLQHYFCVVCVYIGNNVTATIFNHYAS